MINTLDDYTKGQNNGTEEQNNPHNGPYEKKDYGNPDYPVNVNYLDLYKTYMHFIRWHWHEEIEILIIKEGNAKVSTDDATYTVHPGQGIFINQNVMHSIHSADEKNCTFYSIIFHPDFLFGYRHDYMHAQFFLPVQNLPLFKTFILDKSNKQHENMLGTLNKVIAENVTKPFGYEIGTKGRLCYFWSLLIGQLPQLETTPSPHVLLDEQRVKQAVLFIQAHHAEALSLEDIADSIHISKSECCRCFSRTLQMTPFEYLMKYRIFHAARRLVGKDNEPISIADLALSVGFNNTSYFNKLFKKYLGCTPTYYRSHKVVSEEKTGSEILEIPLPPPLKR